MNRLIFLLLTLLGCLTMGQTYAQYRPQFSLYTMNNLLINPAIAGIEPYTDVRAGYRQQYIQFEGAPQTYYVSVHGSLGRRDIARPVPTHERGNRSYSLRPTPRYRRKSGGHHGWGAVVLRDEIGPFARTEANLLYAYHLPLNQRFSLSAGLQGTLAQYSLDWSKMTTANPGDPAIGTGAANQLRPEVSAGFWLYSTDMFVGLSALQMVGGQVSYTEQTPLAIGDANMHLLLTAGHRLRINPNFDLVPSVLVKHNVSGSPSVDVNVMAMLMQRIWAGVSYRHQDALFLSMRFAISPTLDVGYAYDHRMGNRGRFNTTAHELMLGVRINNRFKLLCPQNLW